MAVDVIVSSNNVTVTTSQKTLVGTPGTFENSDASFSVSVASGGTTVGADITLTKNDNTTVSAISNIDLDLGVIDPPADATAENTDQSYQQTVASGGTLVIPDINITKNDDSVVTSPAAIDLDLRIIDPSSPAPATWDEFVAEYGRGYEYPPVTGQLTSYRTGDDKDIEDTIFGATNRNSQTLKARNTLDPTTVNLLNNNNSFGNKIRWTDDAGTEIFTSELMIDHYTGLMWYRILQAAGSTWNEIIDAALASTQGGFSNWFLPSVGQLKSVTDYGAVNTVFLESLNDLTFITIFTSTTLGNNSAFAWRFSNQKGELGFSGKTGTTFRYYICRKHF